MKRSSIFGPAAAAGVSLLLAACQSDVVAPRADATEDEHVLAPTHAARSTGNLAEIIPGEYVVVFRPGANAPRGAAGLMVAAQNGQLRHVYSAALHGFAAALSDSGAARIARHPDVLTVVADQKVTIAGAGTQTGAPWGLDRLDQRPLPLTGSFAYAFDGAGVTVYIVDTGVRYTHVDFGGRAVTGFDAVTSGGAANDCHGHGTHVAGTVGGAKYGVAKAATLVGVRVLDCAGSGSTSSVIAGLDWVLQQKQANPTLRAVVNMSLGGGISSQLDAAVARLVTAGVTTVVAAGNSSADACSSSPARAPSAVTVAATDASDRFASFSNRGTCVDVGAPGVSITSAYHTSTTAYTTMNGTSMAAPHVAGAAALHIAANPSATPADVAAALTGNATANAIVGVPVNTVNRLLYVGYLSGTVQNVAPTATISAPAAGTSVVQGASVTFTGAASDPEDGALSGASLVWRSSVNGQIGTGTSFATSALSVGTHTVTLTATDSKGATGVATRTLTVTSSSTTGTVARVLVHAKSGIGGPSWAMKVGATAQFSVLLYDAAGKSLSAAGRSVTFVSGAPAVATIDAATGLLTARAPGYFSVRATVDGVTGTTGNMTVTP